jgi:hypothetical protein
MNQYKVTNVVWDYDGDEDVNLPTFDKTAFEVSVNDDNDVEDVIADKLSDWGGYTVKSFNYEKQLSNEDTL